MRIDVFAETDPNAKDEDLSKIEIDEEFARRFEHNKKREGLQRYEELKKRGVIASSDDEGEEESLEAEEESSEGDDDEDVFDLEFYNALLVAKKRDPILNQKDTRLFDSSSDEEQEVDGETKKKKEKPMYLKDANYQYLTEMGPEFGEEKLNRNPKIYDGEQEENIKAFLEAEKEAFALDDDGDDILKVKESNVDETAEDENDVEIQKKANEYFGNDDSLNEDDAYLKSYMLNKMWVDKENDGNPIFDDYDVLEAEEELDKQDRYENECNFRHQEVGGDQILGHARFTEGSVRKKTNSRKVQRKSKVERKAHDEFERKEELKHLKNLKKKEIQEKLEKFRNIAGIGKEGDCKLGADDLEEDFDPDEYDKKMREIFGVGYYGAEDADPGFGSGGEGDLEKPDFEEEDKLLGLPKDWDVCGSSEGFKAMRENLLKQEEGEDAPVKEDGKRKKKRKISLKEKVGLDKELEEYYKLDYEDTIGGLKTRFKYKPVPANSYGLRTEEILIADEKNLNQYVSLKKLAPYTEKEWEVTYHKMLKKDSILHGGTSDVHENNKNDGRKADDSIAGKMKKTEDHEESNGDAGRDAEEHDETNGDGTKVSRRMKRRRRQAELKLSRSRLMAYGKIPSKPKKKN